MSRPDRDLEEIRGALEPPSSFEEGFRWSSLFGAVFVALIMVPGAIYMGLLAGQMEVSAAARWVTVILFVEVAKRAHRALRRAEIYVLFFMAAAAMGTPFSGLLWHQFFVHSDAASAAGIAESLPAWYAPPADSASYGARTFFAADWLPAIGLVVFGAFLGQWANLVLGYGLFRVTSDYEKLPFPMAPIGAQGILAIAEDAGSRPEAAGGGSWRWRTFAIGGALGLAFGAVYLLVPTLSGAMGARPIQMLPIPFSDFTGRTGRYLPAVATGVSWDLGNLIVGMVLPFSAMVGSFVGLIVTFVANPLLYRAGILHNWKFGDDTVATVFKNNVDFYFSFQVGLAAAIALAGIWNVARAVARFRRQRRAAAAAAPVPGPDRRGRGDIPAWAVGLCYVGVTLAYIAASALLLRWHHGEWTPGVRRVVGMLFLLGFVYTPLVSYVTARLEGMAGQVVDVPMVREAALILSGYRGVACWFLPLPMANYGQMTVFYRECELTGTRFTSVWKASAFLTPIILLSSIFFMNLIWGLDKVPSAAFPYAQKMWELNAMNQCIVYSATMGDYSIFEQTFKAFYVGCGLLFGGTLFAAMSLLGAPLLLVYGVVRGLGQSLPHALLLQFAGALIGRFYFRRKLGLRWRQYVPVVAAGFACGMGLIATVGVGMTFLNKAVIRLPF
jgi:hypothetical protein